MMQIFDITGGERVCDLCHQRKPCLPLDISGELAPAERGVLPAELWICRACDNPRANGHHH